MPDFNHSYIGGLVLLAQETDSDAFAELYALTYKHIYNYAGHYLRDEYLAQDAVQETYISALKNIKNIKDPSLFVAWLNQICFHVCYDMSKKGDRGGEVNSEFLELLRDDLTDHNPEERADAGWARGTWVNAARASPASVEVSSFAMSDLRPFQQAAP